MEPQTPASFIPKKPLDSSMRARSSGAVGGFLFLIGLFLFVVSLLAAGASFAYKGYLKTSIEDKKASLQKAKEAFDLTTIESLMRVDLRMKQASILLQRHIAPSAIFSFLSAQTLQNVQFTSFNYALQDDGSAAIELEGMAASFSTIALQSDQFAASKALKDIVFSNINVGTEGKIAFSVKATIEPSLINYAKNLTASPAVPVMATSTPVAPAPTSTVPVVPPTATKPASTTPALSIPSL